MEEPCWFYQHFRSMSNIWVFHMQHVYQKCVSWRGCMLAVDTWAVSWQNPTKWHPRSLISAFVVRCLDSIIPLVSIPEISSLWLASEAEQAGLDLTGRKSLKTRFRMTRLYNATLRNPHGIMYIFLKIYKRQLSSLVSCMVSHQAQFVCFVTKSIEVTCHTEGQVTLQIFP